MANWVRKVAGLGAIMFGGGLISSGLAIFLTPVIGMGVVGAAGGTAAFKGTTGGLGAVVGAAGALTMGTAGMSWALMLVIIGVLFVAMGLGALGVTVSPITKIIEAATPFDEIAQIAGGK